MEAKRNYRIKTKGRARIFKNPVLELFTRTSPYVIWGIYLPLSVYIFYLGITRYQLPITQALPIFIGAMLVWTFAEYFLHRYLFHLDEYIKNPKLAGFARKAAWIMHGVHHEYPHDKERLFMPPIPSLILATLLFSLFYLLLGKYVFAFFPGFVLAYLMYATTHYLIHAIPQPPKRFRKLWRHHLLHHYKCPDKAFGVSSMFWDKVFGTVPQELQKK